MVLTPCGKKNVTNVCWIETMLDKDDKVLIKHSAAVQISNTISLFQRKTWNILLANAYDRLLKQDTFEVNIRELAEALEFDSKNLKFLKDNIKQLIGCVVEWDMLDKSGHWEGYGLLSNAKILNGNILQYSYDNELKKKLYHPRTYAKISLGMQRRFTSKHALALYELCVNFFIAKYGKGETPWISVEDFKKMMDVVNEKHYVEFKNLNRHVIGVSIDEINKKSDLFVEVTYQRKNRKVDALKFKITPNPNENNLLHKLDLVDEVTRQKDLPFPENENILAIRHRMAEFGISEKMINDLIQEKGGNAELIEEALDQVNIKMQADRIEKTIAGYAVEVIRNFKSQKSLKEKLLAQAKKASEQIALVAAEQEALKVRIDRDYFDYKKEIVSEYINTLELPARDEVLKKFESSLSVQDKVLYRDGGLERPSMQQHFHQHVIDHYLMGKVVSKEKFSEKYQLE